MIMFITNEYIERILRENNLLGNQNHYFVGTVMPGVLMQGMLGPILNATQMTNFIINKSDNNLILIPCHKASNDALLDKKIVISANEITKVVVSKGNPGFSRATLLKENQELISIQINNAAFDNEAFKQNFNAFVRSFPNEGLELLDTIKPRSPFLKYLGYALIFLIPFMGIYGVFLDSSGEYFIIGLIMLGISIYSGIKIIKNKGFGKK